MTEIPNSINAARRASLAVANSLIMTAIGAVDAGHVEYADAIVCATERVLDGYEAITQLSEVRDLAGEPDKPIPFRPVR